MKRTTLALAAVTLTALATTAALHGRRQNRRHLAHQRSYDHRPALDSAIAELEAVRARLVALEARIRRDRRRVARVRRWTEGGRRTALVRSADDG